MLLLLISAVLGLNPLSKSILRSESLGTKKILNNISYISLPSPQNDLSLTIDTCVSVNSTFFYSCCSNTSSECLSLLDNKKTCTKRRQNLIDVNCPVYKNLNNKCSLTEPCKENLYCNTLDSENNKCLERTENTCTKFNECVRGKICNNKKCINQYSIDVGMSADTRVACKSGIMQNGICQPFELTDSDILPKTCTSNSDCSSKSDIKNHYISVNGRCACLGDKGKYCMLHRSDKLIQEFLSASIEDRLLDFRILNERISLYPLYEFDYDETITDSEAYGYYFQLKSLKNSLKC